MQVTAEVRGRGDRRPLQRGRPRGPEHGARSASTPTATGSRPQRAEATYQQGRWPTRSAPQPDLAAARAAGARSSSWRSEELNRARGEAERLTAEAASAKAARDIAAQNVRRSERARRRARGVINTRAVRDRPVRASRATCWRRSSTSAGCACASRSREARVAARAQAGRRCSFRVAALGDARVHGDRSTTWATWPIPPRGRSRCWPG